MASRVLAVPSLEQDATASGSAIFRELSGNWLDPEKAGSAGLSRYLLSGFLAMVILLEVVPAFSGGYPGIG